jgi:selenocysteine-specific elongation factor
VLPSGARTRVRSVQVHDQPQEHAAAGQRVALNLTGLAVSELARGDVVTAAESDLRPTYLLDCELDFAPEREPEPGSRLQVHHGTRETAARLAWLGGRFWQVRCEQPLIALAGDRLVIRQIAPPDTLGGGRVLDAQPRKHGPSRELLSRLHALSRGERPDEPAGSEPAPGKSLRREPVLPPLDERAGDVEQRLQSAGMEPPPDSELDAAALQALRAHGRAVRVSRTLHYHSEVLAELTTRLTALAERSGGAVTLAQARDELGTSRKFAQALLEHLDSERVFIRRGEEHVLRRRE